jgi:hypothetical protein
MSGQIVLASLSRSCCPPTARTVLGSHRSPPSRSTGFVRGPALRHAWHCHPSSPLTSVERPGPTLGVDGIPADPSIPQPIGVVDRWWSPPAATGREHAQDATGFGAGSCTYRASAQPGPRHLEAAASSPPGHPGSPPHSPQGRDTRRSVMSETVQSSSTCRSRSIPSPPGARPAPPLSRRSR